MDMLVTVTVYVVLFAFVIGLFTVVLAASLFLLEGEEESSFKVDGRAVTWGKCAGITAGVILVSQIPYVGGLLAIVGFFLAIMAFFQKSFLKTLVIWLINGVFGAGIIALLAFLVQKMEEAGWGG